MKYAFNDFELDPGKFELRKRGVLVALEPQVVTLLNLLAERCEQMVSKSDIIEKIWNGRVVSDASIASRIKLARQAVGDNAAATLLLFESASRRVEKAAGSPAAHHLISSA